MRPTRRRIARTIAEAGGSRPEARGPPEGDAGFCPCPLNDAMDLLGSKWTISVVVTGGNFGRLRFHELERD